MFTLDDIMALFPEICGVRMHVPSLWIGFSTGALFLLGCYLLGRALGWQARPDLRPRKIF